MRHLKQIWDIISKSLSICLGLHLVCCSSPSTTDNRFVKMQQEIKHRINLGFNHNVFMAAKNGKGELFIYTNQGITVDGSSIWEIGSLTKLFTAHLTMILQKEGTLSIDTPIKHYIPSHILLPSSIEHITLRHLLCHSSGIVDPMIFGYYNAINGNTTPIADFSQEDFFKYLKQMHLIFSPGTKVEYSNYGYALIGFILEECSKKDYFSLLQEKILSPLNMDETYLEVPIEKKDRLMVGHSDKGEVPYWKISSYPFYGGLKSSGNDLLKYLSFFFFPKENSSFIDELLQPQITWGEQLITTTLSSWTIDNRYGSFFYAMTGKTLGFFSFMGYDPVAKEGLVVLTNTDSFDNLYAHFFNSKFPLTTICPTVPISLEKLKQWEGRYIHISNNNSVQIEIKVQDSQLQLHSPKEQPLFLHYKGKNQFFIKRLDCNGGLIQFKKKFNGKKCLYLQELNHKILFQEIP